jgi:hypothetical protein
LPSHIVARSPQSVSGANTPHCKVTAWR